MTRAAVLAACALAAGCTAPPATMRIGDPVIEAVLAELDGQVPCVAIDFAPPDRGTLRRFMPGMQFSDAGHDLSPAQSYRIEAAAAAATAGAETPPLRAEAPYGPRFKCLFDALGSGDQVARLRQPATAGGIAFVEAHGAGPTGWYVLDDQSGRWTIVARAANYAL